MKTLATFKTLTNRLTLWWQKVICLQCLRKRGKAWASERPHGGKPFGRNLTLLQLLWKDVQNEECSSTTSNHGSHCVCGANSLSSETRFNLINLGTPQKKKRHYLGNFPNMGGGGLPKSQNFCKFTKYFFVCQIQIHSEVLKHVLQMGGIPLICHFFYTGKIFGE